MSANKHIGTSIDLRLFKNVHIDELLQESVIVETFKCTYMNDVGQMDGIIKYYYNQQVYSRVCLYGKDLIDNNVPHRQDMVDHKSLKPSDETMRNIWAKNIFGAALFQYIHGQDLWDFVQKLMGKKIKLSVRHYAIITKQILEWINGAISTERSIVHRDLDPTNIMINSDDDIINDPSCINIKVIDIDSAKALKLDKGFAKALNKYGFKANIANKTRSDTWRDKDGYRPKDAMNGEFSSKTDIFSLGRIIIYMISGKHPANVDLNKYNCHPYLQKMVNEMTNDNDLLRPSAAELLQRKQFKSLCELYKSDGNNKNINTNKNKNSKKRKIFVIDDEIKDENEEPMRKKRKLNVFKNMNYKIGEYAQKWLNAHQLVLDNVKHTFKIVLFDKNYNIDIVASCYYERYLKVKDKHRNRNKKGKDDVLVENLIIALGQWIHHYQQNTMIELEKCYQTKIITPSAKTAKGLKRWWKNRNNAATTLVAFEIVLHAHHIFKLECPSKDCMEKVLKTHQAANDFFTHTTKCGSISDVLSEVQASNGNNI